MKKLVNSTLKTVMILVLFAILLVLNFSVWKKDRQQEIAIQSLQQELLIQQQENAAIAKINADLKEKIISLKRGSYEMIEEEARNNWGMVGENETFFHLEEKAVP